MIEPRGVSKTKIASENVHGCQVQVTLMSPPREREHVRTPPHPSFTTYMEIPYSGHTPSGKRKICCKTFFFCTCTTRQQINPVPLWFTAVFIVFRNVFFFHLNLIFLVQVLFHAWCFLPLSLVTSTSMKKNKYFCIVIVDAGPCIFCMKLFLCDAGFRLRRLAHIGGRGSEHPFSPIFFWRDENCDDLSGKPVLDDPAYMPIFARVLSKWPLRTSICGSNFTDVALGYPCLLYLMENCPRKFKLNFIDFVIGFTYSCCWPHLCRAGPHILHYPVVFLYFCVYSIV